MAAPGVRVAFLPAFILFFATSSSGRTMSNARIVSRPRFSYLQATPKGAMHRIFRSKSSSDRKLTVKARGEVFISPRSEEELQQRVTNEKMLYPAVGDVVKIKGKFAEDIQIGQIRSLRFDIKDKKWVVQVESLTEYSNGLYDIGRDSEWKPREIDELTPVCAFYVRARNCWKVMSRTTSDASKAKFEPLLLAEAYDLPAEPSFMPDVLTGRGGDMDGIDQAKLRANERFTQFLNEIVTFKAPLIAETLLYAGLGAAWCYSRFGDDATNVYMLGVLSGIGYVVLLNDEGGPARIAIPAILIASLAQRNANLEGLKQWVGTERTFSLVPKEQFFAAMTGFITHRLPLLRKGAFEVANLITELSKTSSAPPPKLDPVSSVPRVSPAENVIRGDSNVKGRIDDGTYSSRGRRQADVIRRKAQVQQQSKAFLPDPSQVLSSETSTEAGIDIDEVEIDPKYLYAIYVSGPPGVDTDAVVRQLAAMDPRLKEPRWTSDTTPASDSFRDDTVQYVTTEDYNAKLLNGDFVAQKLVKGEFGMPDQRFGLTAESLAQACEGGMSAIMATPISSVSAPLPDLEPIPAPTEDNNDVMIPREFKRIGLLVLPQSQVSQERAIRDFAESTLADAQRAGKAVFNDPIERQVALKRYADSCTKEVDPWIQKAAKNSEFYYTLADFPDEDKGIGSFLKFVEDVCREH
mmetsp:Transcript_14008/g.21200  ORF Transcript_14008/g.21200 Transcript_14008/m.21200 type:complete len:691 (+) Transcript_14008:56-2128(+)